MCDPSRRSRFFPCNADRSLEGSERQRALDLFQHVYQVYCIESQSGADEDDQSDLTGNESDASAPPRSESSFMDSLYDDDNEDEDEGAATMTANEFERYFTRNEGSVLGPKEKGAEHILRWWKVHTLLSICCLGR